MLNAVDSDAAVVCDVVCCFRLVLVKIEENLGRILLHIASADVVELKCNIDIMGTR